jgi:methylthioribose-1-phosphate isomerase
VDWHWSDGAFWTGEAVDAGAARPGPVLHADRRAGIEIEERSATEVTELWGRGDDGRPTRIHIAPHGTRAANPAFDVTPARLVTGLISERGVTTASRAGLAHWRRPAG